MAGKCDSFSASFSQKIHDCKYESKIRQGTGVSFFTSWIHAKENSKENQNVKDFSSNDFTASV